MIYIIYIIGSTKHYDRILKCKECVKVINNCRDAAIIVPEEHPTGTVVELAKLSFNRMDLADIVVAVPKPDRTFGESTSYELAYAFRTNKSVFVYDYVLGHLVVWSEWC